MNPNENTIYQEPQMGNEQTEMAAQQNGQREEPAAQPQATEQLQEEKKSSGAWKTASAGAVGGSLLGAAAIAMAQHAHAQDDNEPAQEEVEAATATATPEPVAAPVTVVHEHHHHHHIETSEPPVNPENPVHEVISQMDDVHLVDQEVVIVGENTPAVASQYNVDGTSAVGLDFDFDGQDDVAIIDLNHNNEMESNEVFFVEDETPVFSASDDSQPVGATEATPIMQESEITEQAEDPGLIANTDFVDSGIDANMPDYVSDADVQAFEA